jgi:hypothetical protein
MVAHAPLPVLKNKLKCIDRKGHGLVSRESKERFLNPKQSKQSMDTAETQVR